MIDLTKAAPDLVDLAKKAEAAIAETHLPKSQKFSVYLLMDHSTSAKKFFNKPRGARLLARKNGSSPMSHMADMALATSAIVDDDGVVDSWYFASDISPVHRITIGQHQGFVDRTHIRQPWGGTDYIRALKTIEKYHKENDTRDPALVYFQTDGNPSNDWNLVMDRIVSMQKTFYGFIVFVGFGPHTNLGFLRSLGAQTAQRLPVPNCALVHVPDPYQMDEQDFYAKATAKIPTWLADVHQRGLFL